MVPIEELPEWKMHVIRYWFFDGYDDLLALRARFPRHTLRYYFFKGIEWALRVLRIGKRRAPLPVWIGSAQWILPAAACRHILERVEDRRLVRFFRTSFAPDELIFHTILGNSPFAAQMQPARTYLDSTGSIPITRDHLPLLAPGRDDYPTCSLPYFPHKSKLRPLFARKFDDNSAEICAEIDRTLRGVTPA